MNESAQAFTTGRVVCFVLEISFPEGKDWTVECYSHEGVKHFRKIGNVLYFSRFANGDGTIEDQLGYGEDMHIGEKAFRFICPGDGGHPRWVTGSEPTAEIMSEENCPLCQF